MGISIRKDQTLRHQPHHDSKAKVKAIAHHVLVDVLPTLLLLAAMALGMAFIAHKVSAGTPLNGAVPPVETVAGLG